MNGKIIVNGAEITVTTIDDKDYIQKEAPGYGYYSDGYTASVEESAEDSGAQSTIRDIRITYMLNSGLKVERWYSLYLTPDRMAREGTYDYLLDQLINSPEIAEAAGEAMRALLGEGRVKLTDEWASDCTDMGDLSCVMPTLQPHIEGAAGPAHGDDYHIADRELACVSSAKGQLMLMALLLENGAARAKQAVERYHAPYASKEEYFAALDSILCDRALIEYYGAYTAEVHCESR